MCVYILLFLFFKEKQHLITYVGISCYGTTCENIFPNQPFCLFHKQNRWIRKSREPGGVKSGPVDIEDIVLPYSGDIFSMSPFTDDGVVSVVE